MSVTLLSSALLMASLSPFAADLEDDAKRYLNLTEVDVQRLDVPDAVQPSLIEFEVDGLTYSMDVRPQSMRSADYMLLVDVNGTMLAHDPGPARTFRGELLEDPGSIVAGSFMPEGLYARILFSSGQTFWIEPLVGRVPGARADQYAVYDEEHVLGSSGFCGTDTSGHIDSHTTGGGEAPAGGALEITEIGIDADFEFYQDHSSNVNHTSARMELVLNTMNVQYENEVGITHVISAAIVRTTSGAPYTSSNPSTLLNQFLNHWNSAQSGLRRDVAHLFTGKNLDGSVIGIAYLGVICTSSGYGVVQSDCCGSLSCAADLSAHELGHNWNAGHCNCSNFTMNSSLTCANQFSSGTESSIISHRNSRNCLDDGTILYEDDFESDNFTAGGWTISSATRCKVKKSAAYTGLRGAKLKKGGQGTGGCTLGTSETWIHTPSFSTVGFSSVQLQVHGHFRKNELNCEFLAMQVSVNGGAWTTFDTLEKHGWDYYRMNLPGSASGQGDVRIRFLTNAKGKQKRAEIDNVRVIGF
jgi:hypothetical protein